MKAPRLANFLQCRGGILGRRSRPPSPTAPAPG